MNSQENASGRPLADSKWLENHHIAKLPERKAFANKVSACTPKSIVDLGCATGLWLDLFDKTVSDDCIFIGIDSDNQALDLATERSKKWSRSSSFLCMDIERDADKIPAADLTLAFNIFPYIRDIDTFIETLSKRQPKGILAVRQYDGASIRFGPMPTNQRQSFETSLRVATESSSRFNHYDMDRTFTALHRANYNSFEYDFELFKRFSPFKDDFIPYYRDMLLWTCDHVSEDSSAFLHNWINEDPDYLKSRYFYEVDLVAVLS